MRISGVMLDAVGNGKCLVSGPGCGGLKAGLDVVVASGCRGEATGCGGEYA